MFGPPKTLALMGLYTGSWENSESISWLSLSANSKDSGLVHYKIVDSCSSEVWIVKVVL